LLGGLMWWGHWIEHFLAPVVGESVEPEGPIPPLAVTLLALAVVLAGVAVAWLVFGRKPVPREAPQDVSFVTRAARADLYGDAINEDLVVAPGRSLVSGLTAFDRVAVDGSVEGGALAVSGLGQQLRKAQNGFVRSYALALLGGVLLVVMALLAVNLV
jgi:NADH-quinone oxidoreductase subunit L